MFLTVNYFKCKPTVLLYSLTANFSLYLKLQFDCTRPVCLQLLAAAERSSWISEDHFPAGYPDLHEACLLRATTHQHCLQNRDRLASGP